jgi:FlaA1/EpsC-like NDP-sugar epimerase
MSGVAGKRVLLTGAGGAFGKAARQLLEHGGARVVGLDLEAGAGVESPAT